MASYEEIKNRVIARKKSNGVSGTVKNTVSIDKDYITKFETEVNDYYKGLESLSGSGIDLEETQKQYWKKSDYLTDKAATVKMWADRNKSSLSTNDYNTLVDYANNVINNTTRVNNSISDAIKLPKKLEKEQKKATDKALRVGIIDKITDPSKTLPTNKNTTNKTVVNKAATDHWSNTASNQPENIMKPGVKKTNGQVVSEMTDEELDARIEKIGIEGLLDDAAKTNAENYFKHSANIEKGAYEDSDIYKASQNFENTFGIEDTRPGYSSKKVERPENAESEADIDTRLKEISKEQSLIDQELETLKNEKAFRDYFGISSSQMGEIDRLSGGLYTKVINGHKLTENETYILARATDRVLNVEYDPNPSIVTSSQEKRNEVLQKIYQLNAEKNKVPTVANMAYSIGQENPVAASILSVLTTPFAGVEGIAKESNLAIASIPEWDEVNTMADEHKKAVEHGVIPGQFSYDFSDEKAMERYRNFTGAKEKENPVELSAGGIPVQKSLSYNDVISPALSRNLSAMTDFKTYSRAGVESTIENDVLRWIYSGTMSTLDSGLCGLTGGHVGLLLNASAGASQKIDEIIENGGTVKQALVMGLSITATEYITENIGFDNFLKLAKSGTTGGKEIIKTILKQSGVEAMEETASEFATQLVELGVLGENSTIAINYNEARKNGLSHEEAVNKVMLTFAEDLVSAAASGAFSGFLFGTAGNVSSAVNAKNIDKLNKSAIATAKQITDPEEFIRKIINDYPENEQIKALVQSYISDPSDVNLGMVALAASETAVQDVLNMKAGFAAEISHAEIKDISKELIRKGVQESSVENLAPVISAVVNRGTTSNNKIKSVIDNPQAKAVLEERTGLTLTGTRADSVKQIRQYMEGQKKQTANTDRQTVNTTVSNADIDSNLAVKIPYVEKSNIYYPKTSQTEHTLKTADGEIVSTLENVGEETARAVTEVVKQLPSEAAAVYVDGLSRNITTTEEFTDYTTSWARAYTQGLAGVTPNAEFTDWIKSKDTAYFNLDTGIKALETGVKYRDKIAVEKSKNVTRGEGKLIVEQGTVVDTRKKKAEVKYLENISKITGATIHVVSSAKDNNGNYAWVGEIGKKYFQNGMFVANTGEIYVDLNAGVKGEGITLYTASHELVHYMAQNNPAQYRAMAKWLFEQYGKKNISLDNYVRQQMASAKANGQPVPLETAYEEVVASACETMLIDGDLVAKLKGVKQSWVKSVVDWLKKFTNKIKSWYSKLNPSSAEALEVRKTLDIFEGLQERFEAGLVGLAKMDTVNNIKITDSKGVKLQARQNASSETFTEEKYFKSQMSKWNDLKYGDYVNVGTISSAHPLCKIGFPNGVLRYDVVKLKKNMEDHGDYLTVDLLKAIPDIIANPMVISKYSQDNTVSVFGDCFVNNSPMMVGVTLSKDRAGNDICKVRTYNTRRDVAKLITNDSILYLNENKKRTLEWFQACGIQVPLGGTKFGLIRRIALNHTSVKNQNRDSAGNKLSPEQSEYFKDSKVRDENGNLLVMYHGTPNAGFTQFKSGTYFTQNKEYADMYQNQGASSLSYKKTANNPDTYAVYLDIKKPFDTRNKAERDIFYKEYYRKYGTGTNLMESGLPDWTEGMDLQEFIEEKGYEYDGLILDEGAVGGYGNAVVSRGLSYVVFNASQVKNIDNTAPTSNQDIRYQYRNAPVNTELLSMVDNVENNNYKPNDKVYFRNVADDIAKKIQNLTGIDVTGFRVAIEARQMEHILKDHGPNGRANHSMEDPDDIAKMEFALLSPDDISVAGRTKAYSVWHNGRNRTAPTVLYEKNIGDKSYYVVQAVPDTEAKTLYIVSAFIGNSGYKNKASQSTNANSPGATSGIAAANASTESIQSEDNSVNKSQWRTSRTQDILLNAEPQGSAEARNLAEYKKYHDMGVEFRKQLADYNEQLKKNPNDKTLKSEIVKTKNRLATADKGAARAEEKLYSLIEREVVNSIMERAKDMDSVKKEYASHVENFGTHEKRGWGRDVDTPLQINDKTKVSKHVDSIMKNPVLTDEMVDTLQAGVVEGLGSYVPISDKSAIASAEVAISKQGYESSLREFQGLVNAEQMSKHTIALGEALLNEAAKQNNVRDVVQISAELAHLATLAGQTVQAFSLLRKMDGLGRVVYVQQEIDRVNRKLIKKGISLKAPKDLMYELGATKDENRQAEISDQIFQNLADQMPVTMLEKLNEWRYLAMLGNPKTHLRNMFGNGVFLPVVRFKDVIKLTLEKTIKNAKNTTVLKVNKKYRAMAEQDFEVVGKDLFGSGSKYSTAESIRDKRKIFKTQFLEWLRKQNSAKLEGADLKSCKRHYIHALGGYLQANNLNIDSMNEKDRNEARLFAVREAERATFRDFSNIASAMNRIAKQNPALGFIMDSAIPFKKTPINILKRGVEYSPLGLMKGLYDAAVSVKKGTKTVNQVIEEISAGLTGTGLTLIGWLMASMGWLRIGREKKKEEQFSNLQGHQSYSLEIFGVSVTIDWMSPSAMPLFVGAELHEVIENNEDMKWTDYVNAMLNITEPMYEMSMLSGIKNLFDSSSYSSNSLNGVFAELTASYISQFVPTFLGQAARSIDTTRRTAYVESDDVTGIIEETAEKLMNKIPGVSFFGAEYIDQWGRVDTADNAILNAVENFISPGYLNKVSDDPVEKWIYDLYEKTGNTAVLPGYASKSFTVDGKEIQLTQEEYNTYAKRKGSLSYEIVSDLYKSDILKNQPVEVQEKVIRAAYDWANQIAKSEISNFTVDKSVGYALEADSKGLSIADFLVTYKVCQEFCADKKANGDSISGSKKRKQENFINNLPIDYSQKDWLKEVI